MKVEEKYMYRSLELAELGIGHAAPNPMVGCVIVHNNKIIGEGYHRKCGEAHAEVNAVNSVKDHELLKESTLYVTLEPCAHYGKTPPCSEMIIKKQIPRVVVGTVDPFAKVAGLGIQMMKEAGIEVVVGCLQNECRELNRRFFTFHKKKRPFVILKWAQTIDGFLDIDRSVEEFGQPTWITNNLARTAVHKLRAGETAIMVGTNTAQKDNPSLTVRDWEGKHPVRIVLDRSMRLRQSLKLFDQTVPTLVFTEEAVPSKRNLDYIQIDFTGNVIEEVMTELHCRDIQSIIVEGGAHLLNGFVELNLWDEAQVYVGERFFHEGIKAPLLSGEPLLKHDFRESHFWYFRNFSAH